FYIAFPFILGRVRHPSHAVVFLIVTATISLGTRLWFAHSDLPATFAYHSFLPNLALFAIGLLAYRCVVAWPTHSACRLVVVAAMAPLALLPLRGTVFPVDAGQSKTLLWGCAFGTLCAWQAVRPSRLLSCAAMQWLGERSFSIYLMHGLVIFVLRED